MLCNFCYLLCENVSSYLRHIRIHRSLKLFECSVNNCKIVFKCYRSFRQHLRQRHLETTDGPLRKCTLATCTYEETDLCKLMKHAQKHITEGHPVYCPLRCPRQKPFATYNSLRLHKLYYHKFDFKKLKTSSSNCTMSIDSENIPDKSPAETLAGNFHETTGVEENNKESLTSSLEKLFASLFLKLLSKHHITETALQEIVDALSELAVAQNKLIEFKCEVVSDELKLSEVSKTKIIKAVCDNSLQNMFGPDGSFRSPHMRKKIYCENFSFVSPEKIPLQRNRDHNECFYYYVPILETLKNLLNDKQVYEAFFRDKIAVPGYLCDYTDGLKFKNSSFFNKKTLNLFIYQDAAEVVVNAIGNATARHKLLCVYMVLGNLDSHLRVLTDNVQLILLCKNKDFSYFGMNSVFRRLVEDLKVLEEDGIDVQVNGTNEKIFGSVFTTMNDNLGAHQIAGLVENFSRSSHFCRSCYIDHASFAKDPLCTAGKRTPATNDQDLTIIRQNPCTIPYRGVKNDSIFNELQHFNIFDCGTAPCVAHDIFEGWANYDIFLIFKRMISEQTLSASYLQGRANSVFKQLKINTKIDFNFTRKSKNFKAKACDIWHLIQIIPFIFIQKAVDYSDPMILMLLLIKKITDTITSPVLTETQIRILAADITEYIETREIQFTVPLRPKHHFCTHYPQLMLWMGPLMTYCTLFCERKHCFFKRCLRSTLNFKNVTKFCSEQHQLYHGILSMQNSRFQNNFLVENYTETIEDLPMRTQSFLRDLSLDDSSNMYVDKGTYLGYSYANNSFLFMNHDEFGEVFFVMQIKLIIYNKQSRRISVLGSEVTVNNVHEKGLMEIVSNDEGNEKWICKNIDEFIDRAPMASLEENRKQYLFTKHSIPFI